MVFTLIVVGLAVFVPGFAYALRFAGALMVATAFAMAVCGAPLDAAWALCAAGVAYGAVWLRGRFLLATA